jgi:hypothetical protein
MHAMVSESARHRKEEADRNGTLLSEDYAEIVDEEGDYSTPASQYHQSSLSIVIVFFFISVSGRESNLEQYFQFFISFSFYV